MKGRKQIPEIAKSQRFMNKPPLGDIFGPEVLGDRRKRDKSIGKGSLGAWIHSEGGCLPSRDTFYFCQQNFEGKRQNANKIDLAPFGSFKGGGLGR